MAIKTQTITKGDKYNLYNQFDTGFISEGYNLYGWDTNQNASIPEYAQGANGSFDTNTDLYAIWSEKEIYHVTFNPNGGYEESYRLPFEKDVKKHLMKNKFTLNDYLFNGWSTNINGTKIYNDEQEISITEDMNLYALWRSEDEPETPIILVINPLTFTSTGDSTISLNGYGNPAYLDYIFLTYLIDNNNPLIYNIGTRIDLSDGQKLKMYATSENTTISKDGENYYKFSMTGSIAASGNINTLLKADSSVIDLTGRNTCYANMFSDCSSLTQAPELPATTLAIDCYYRMFAGCSSLTQVPELPVTTLAGGCYKHMFTGCTSLTQAPELPAKTLADWCYSGMFSGCSQLNTLSVRFTEWPMDGYGYTLNWLYNISETGTFYCPSELSDIRGASKIPEGWNIVNIQS